MIILIEFQPEDRLTGNVRLVDTTKLSEKSRQILDNLKSEDLVLEDPWGLWNEIYNQGAEVEPPVTVETRVVLWDR